MARSGEVNYIDETSWFQSGALNRLRVMANNPVAYFMIHKNRSKEAFHALVQEREGILVSDNYGVYAKWINLRQTCLAHIIRKAKALAERKDENVSQFGKQVVQDLQLLCHWAKSPSIGTVAGGVVTSPAVSIVAIGAVIGGLCCLFSNSDEEDNK